jgi:cytochrome c peroxidase
MTMGTTLHFRTLAGALLALSLVAAPAQADDIAALKAAYKRPPPRPVENAALVALGRQLFWDPRVSASGKTACASCHFPYLGWATTEPRSRNDSGKLTSRRSQPLIGIGHVEDVPYGWDGRNPSLEAQAKSSIATGSMSMRETDSPVKLEIIEARVAAVPAYVEGLAKALPGKPFGIDAVVTAIAAFERTLEPGEAPFDRWIAGDEDAIAQSAKRGFQLFAGKGNCAACHFGWRLTDDGFHDIGTSKTDRGRGREMKEVAVMQFAFKTPSLRSVALRPPYMHNGMAANLYEAVKHYETGGIDRPSRSPEMKPLRLTETERQDLVAFLQTLTGMPEGEAAPELPK